MPERSAIHPAARAGFAAGAEIYQRSRPDYPAAALEWLARELALGAGPVLDVAAGTGKLTRQLRPLAPHLVAVEPVAAMRRVLSAALPGVSVVGGRAEALPFRSAWAGAALAGQAFHWFDGRAALEELHRVLWPGGGLGLLWNHRDESVDWMRRLTEIVEPVAGDAPRFRSGRWREAFAAQDLFGPLQEATFDHAQTGSPELVVERVASISFVAALDESRRESLLDEVRRLLATHPDTCGQGAIRLPYRTLACWARRR
ncbi:MAG TPA: class I SAM-dependent methyltransferase [Anaeromyxobacteraceae bacterium]|nr:class I SAM-dependent methyltransferase [Anaeromyxobacteraceae bacterium]